MKMMNMIFTLMMFTAFSGCLFDEEPYAVPKDPDSVVTIAEGTFPSLSPDGRMMAFIRFGAVFVADTGGRAVRMLTTMGSNDIIPQWRPDGKTIGFVRKNYSSSVYGTLMEVDTATGAMRTISADGAVLCLPENMMNGTSGNLRTSYVSAPEWSWGPDGKHVAFYSGTDSMTMLSIAGTNSPNDLIGNYVLYRNTRGSAWFSTAGFCWTPGGDQILCTSNVNADSSFLYLITVSRNEMVRMNSYKKASNPSISSNGRLIGFRDLVHYEYPLYDAQVDSVVKRLYVSYSPKLSPDGKKVVYYSYSYSGNPDAYPTSNLNSADVSTGVSRMIALSNWDYYFVIDPTSRYVYLSRNGYIRRAEIPQ